MQTIGGPRLSARPQNPVTAELAQKIGLALQAAGGWLPFDRYMAMALYEPGLGYYARGHTVFGTLPEDGSDFVTAPELSPLFGQALARQVAQALQAVSSGDIIEFGAGSGALAAQVLQALGSQVRRYRIVELSSALRARQAQRLAPFAAQVQWLDAWPDTIEGVVLGNEVLDAMPVQLLHWDGTQWLERGVCSGPDGAWAWADRATALRPPVDGGFVPGTVVEIHPQAEAFVRSLAQRLVRGVALFIDYGFPEAEYYHPQRTGGTLMCHRAHRADSHPLLDVGEKDITAHVNFSGLALAAQDAGLQVLGYTSQAHFLINCGLPELLQGADVQTLAHTQKLMAEHEMGELFKVLALARGVALDALGFVRGDRCHML